MTPLRWLSRMPRAGWRLVMGGVLLVAMIFGAPAYGALTRDNRIDPGLRAAQQGTKRVNVIVELGFAPAQFHLKLLQGYGILGAVRGHTVQLSRVSPENLRALTLIPWVSNVVPAPAVAP